MSKKVAKVVELQFPAGGARPGPALASAGVNMPQFCSAFNDATKEMAGSIVPVIITAFEDKSFTFVLKTVPASVLLLKAAKIEKGSSNAKTTKVGKITMEDLKKIAEDKSPLFANAPVITSCVRCQISSASCSTQPGLG